MIILVPLGLLIWLGNRLANDEQVKVEQKFRSLFDSRLAEVEAALKPAMLKMESELLDLLDAAELLPEDGLRKMSRDERFVRQVFVADDSGRLIYPNLQVPATQREADFARRTASIWEGGMLLPGGEEQAGLRKQGWLTWFWGAGVQFIYWRVSDNSRIYGIEVERAALLAELVNALPDSGDNVDAPWISLSDPTGEVIYGWGGEAPKEETDPVAERMLVHPLAGWKVSAYPPEALVADTGVPASSLFNIVAGLVVAAFVLVALGVYFYRAHAREMREAGQRVNFVNQVSHELKTPLTNIRLYAEMLAREIPDEDERAKSCLDVVVDESGRLSRLINNVLTFAKKQRGQGDKIKPKEGVVDDVIQSTLAHFAPSMEANELEVVFEGNAKDSARFDSDLLEQILSNLFGNVEKYASDGGKMIVESSSNGSSCEITVTDNGPGISRGDRARIFKPFVRLSESVTEGVSGTGIGLTIARQLARDHGGDLVYESPKGGGSRFVVTLQYEKGRMPSASENS